MSKNISNIDTKPSLEAFIFSVAKLVTNETVKPQPVLEFDPASFKKTLHAFGTSLSSEASKFSLAFKPPAIVEHSGACTSLLTRLEQLYIFINSIPLDQGETLRNEILNAGQEVFKASINLGNSFLAQPIKSDLGLVDSQLIDFEEKKAYLKSTGLLWETCDNLKELPADNKEAVLKQISKIIGLVEDAINEIQEMLEEAKIIPKEAQLALSESKTSKYVFKENKKNDTSSFLKKNSDDDLTDCSSVSSSFDDLDDFTGLKVGTVKLTIEQQSIIKSISSVFKLSRLILTKISLRNIPESDGTDKSIPKWLDLLLGSAKELSECIDDLASNLWDKDNEDEIRKSLRSLMKVVLALVDTALLHSADKHTLWFNGAKDQLQKVEKKILEEVELW